MRAKANGREPTSSLDRVFNFRLGCFTKYVQLLPIQARSSLELTIQPKFCTVSLSLPMAERLGATVKWLVRTNSVENGRLPQSCLGCVFYADSQISVFL